MSWIQQVLDATEEAESPRAFIYWAALASIAAVMRKNVWIDKHLYKLYPNIYVLLVAKSGMRKAFPITLAKRLVRLTKVTRVIAGRNTVQAIIRDLATAYTLPQGGLITDGHGFLAAGEFSSFIIRDQDALTILTDLYDTYDHEPEWRNLLKSGIETIANPCITMLGASNQTHLRDKISEVDIDGGFIGRTLMIVGETKYKLNPLMEAPVTPIDFDALAEHLKEISRLKGQFIITPEGKDIYSKWYLDFNSKEHDDRTGTSNRIHDHILKVSMLIALSQRAELSITGQDMQAAISACLGFMVNVNKTVMPGTKSALSEPTKLVMSELLNRPDHKIPRNKLLQKFWGDLDSMDLDRIIETLTQAGLILQSSSNQGPVYSLSPTAVRKYLEFKEIKAS
jgi:hypothetical protein